MEGAGWFISFVCLDAVSNEKLVSDTQNTQYSISRHIEHGSRHFCLFKNFQNRLFLSLSIQNRIKYTINDLISTTPI